MCSEQSYCAACHELVPCDAMVWAWGRYLCTHCARKGGSSVSGKVNGPAPRPCASAHVRRTAREPCAAFHRERFTNMIDQLAMTSVPATLDGRQLYPDVAAMVFAGDLRQLMRAAAVAHGVNPLASAALLVMTEPAVASIRYPQGAPS